MKTIAFALMLISTVCTLPMENVTSSQSVQRLEKILELSRDGNFEEAQRLLSENKALVMCTDAEGNTPLHYAAENDHLALVALLISAGAPVNSVNDKKQTPYDRAYFLKHERIVTYLSQHGGEPGGIWHNPEVKHRTMWMLGFSPRP